MIQLQDYQSELQGIIDSVGQTLNLEAALFDTQSKLIASTSTYLEQKGHAVHAPSIEEVLQNGRLLVNKPGFMKSCIGCRFKDNCPSTIEILNSIKVDQRPVGVITLTSFTKAGHNRITEHIDVYANMLNIMTDLIANLVYYKSKSHHLETVETLFQATLNSNPDSLLAVDNQGGISHANASAHKLFAFCGLYTRSLRQVIPDYIGTRILAGQTVTNEMVRINNNTTLVSSVPLHQSGTFSGALVRFSDTTLVKPKPAKEIKAPAFSLQSLKGDSPQMSFLKERIIKIANSASTVLITGETGTGKGVAAKAIHFVSQRKNFPLISINCASIPENLFESELFGYEEGAFTGARKGGKPGQFELAQHGTLFLDEIGELPMHVQSKLLKVLQDHTIERVGGMNSLPIDVRIIAATNKNLEAMVAAGHFREDLYYRLNVIPLTVAPLRERREDMMSLAESFLEKYNLRIGKKIKGFSDAALKLMHQHPWPGNIRELENCVEYAVNIEDGPEIELRSLPERYWSTVTAPTSSSALSLTTPMSGSSVSPSQVPARQIVLDAEYQQICSALDRHGWHVKGKETAAKELGMGLRTLYRKLGKK